MRRLGVLLGTAAVVGALLAGCGSSAPAHESLSEAVSQFHEASRGLRRAEGKVKVTREQRRGALQAQGKAEQRLRELRQIQGG